MHALADACSECEAEGVIPSEQLPSAALPVEYFPTPSEQANMKFMTEADIPQFVEDILETGCEITAVMGESYVIGDADLDLEEYLRVAPRIAEITMNYGVRDHLLPQIVIYLVSIGRYYPKQPDLRVV